MRAIRSGSFTTTDGSTAYEEETFKYQRWYFLQGWIDMLLPTDPPHWATRSFDAHDPVEVVCPDGWEWEGDWTPSGMWEYSKMSRGTYLAKVKAGMGDIIRRQRWTRLRRGKQSPPEEGQPPPDTPVPAAAGDSSTPDCVVCMDNPQCMVVTVCGHMSLCEECGAAVSECPMCRKPFSRDQIIRVYQA